ncbi:uncharacterized protein LOC112042683 [Lingula anatina]|uniref:Uncharacterized protein LOC112042683 n=1 Tax=Lingula anatina TaxID=7574 RepID=A0A2R2MT16_LINAN|nr:uncharacterized protein LOC112042683 [Lingula anatina]|eukprot:XP_023933389.1 uncharacterized protein LOC112042683 [Lingula anatina]
MFAAAALRVKANLEEKDSNTESEIRRFTVEQQSSESTLFSGLKQKVSEVFPALQNSQKFKLYWKDPEEGEKIAFSSEEEMKEALSQAQSKDGTFNIYVKRDEKPDPQQAMTDSNSPVLKAFRDGARAGWDDSFGTPDSEKRKRHPWGHYGRHWGGRGRHGCRGRGRGPWGPMQPPPFHPGFEEVRPSFPPSFYMEEGTDGHPPFSPPPHMMRGMCHGWGRMHPYMKPHAKNDEEKTAQGGTADKEGENNRETPDVNLCFFESGPTGSDPQGAGEDGSEVDWSFGEPGRFGHHGHGFGHGHLGHRGHRGWCHYMHQLHQDFDHCPRCTTTEFPQAEENQKEKEASSDCDAMDIDTSTLEGATKQQMGYKDKEFSEGHEAKISKGLRNLELRGYRNDNGWLSRLLVEHQGDVRKVLEVIKPREN